MDRIILIATKVVIFVGSKWYLNFWCYEIPT